MRRHLLASLLVATAWAAGDARADGRDAPEIITENPTAGRQGLYIVQEGDTLWDLCDVFFGEPWFWPTLWSYNPQLTSPHWIYPGDLLQMRAPRGPGSERTIVWSDSTYSREKINIEIEVRYVGYLPERPFKPSGEIAHARGEQVTLGTYDEVYVEFRQDVGVKRGERFTIYRVAGEIEHPITGDTLGYKIEHLGIGKVLDADHHYVKILILKAFEEISRGDLVTSLFPMSWTVAPRTNEVEVAAVLVDFHKPTRFGGQYHYAYLDKGRVHGLKRGNRFEIQRRGDGAWDNAETERDPEELEKFPWERMGEGMIVEPFEETSIAVVTSAIKELVPGDRMFFGKGY
jgi:hypothetical protein